MVSKHSHMPGAWTGRHEVNRNGHKVSLSPLGSMLTANHWCKIKMPISVFIMPVPCRCQNEVDVVLFPSTPSRKRAEGSDGAEQRVRKDHLPDTRTAVRTGHCLPCHHLPV